MKIVLLNSEIIIINSARILDGLKNLFNFLRFEFFNFIFGKKIIPKIKFYSLISISSFESIEKHTSFVKLAEKDVPNQ